MLFTFNKNLMSTHRKLIENPYENCMMSLTCTICHYLSKVVIFCGQKQTSKLLIGIVM